MDMIPLWPFSTLTSKGRNDFDWEKATREAMEFVESFEDDSDDDEFIPEAEAEGMELEEVDSVGEE